jgi:hypothetical protein
MSSTTSVFLVYGVPARPADLMVCALIVVGFRVVSPMSPRLVSKSVSGSGSPTSADTWFARRAFLALLAPDRDVRPCRELGHNRTVEVTGRRPSWLEEDPGL